MSNWRSLVPVALASVMLSGGMFVWGCEQPGSPAQSEAAQQSEAPRQSDAMLKGGASHELAQVRRATARYQDTRKAAADGYEQFSPHVPNMGTHYLTRSAIGVGGSSALDHDLDRMEPEILVYVNDASQSRQMRLVAAEYAVPKDGATPPQEAVELFSAAGASEWHVHPSVHELPLSDAWTVHGECHYEGGLGVFLVETPAGDFVLWTPPTGAFGSWSGTVAPDQCPTSLGGDPLPPLLIGHGKWWTLHTWVWMPNPDGVFHPTNPRVSG